MNPVMKLQLIPETLQRDPLASLAREHPVKRGVTILQYLCGSKESGVILFRFQRPDAGRDLCVGGKAEPSSHAEMFCGERDLQRNSGVYDADAFGWDPILRQH